MDREQVKAKLLELFPQKRITCAEARKLAAEWGIELVALGQIINETDIKISRCQLGCF